MEYIEEVRKEKGITVTYLCDKIGVNRTTYYKWTNGDRKPKLQTIKMMCDVLEIDFTENVEKFI